MKAVLFFVCLFLAVGLFSTPAPVEAARSKELVSLLKDMMAKLNEYQSSANEEISEARTERKQEIKATTAEVKKLEEQFEKAEGKLETLQEQDKVAAAKAKDSLHRAEAQYNKERQLIKKILGMLKHEVGMDKEHPARSCDEVFLDATRQSGTYWVLQKGASTKTKCVRKLAGMRMVSAGCSKTTKTGGWKALCFDDVDFNTDKDTFQTNANTITIKKAGTYRINANIGVYAAPTHHIHARVRVNNQQLTYYYREHVHKWHQVGGDFTWTFPKNAVVQIETHTSGSDPWNWRSKKGDIGYNRVQIQYLGAQSDVVFLSGGCSGHSRGTGWRDLCLNKVEINNAKEHLEAYKDGKIIVRRPGFYRITSEHISHSSSSKHAQLLINGNQKTWADNWANGWCKMNLDWSGHLKENDQIRVRAKSNGGNPYRWHSHGTTSHPARIQVILLSDDETASEKYQMYTYGNSGHRRNTAWYEIPNQQRTEVTMKSSTADFQGSGNVVVKKDGWFRVNAHVHIHGGWGPQIGKITVNDKIITVCQDTEENSWNNHHQDVTWPLAKGDVMKVWWRAQGGDPYVHQMSGASQVTGTEVHLVQ